MIQILMVSVLICIPIYLLYYFVSAKRKAPITSEEARLLWKIHKNDSGCTHKKWNVTKRGKHKIVGFKCDCGYKYAQRRPLVVGMPIPN
ncbi:hypothetical protein KAI12_03765 [Candidatus Bathyarchaeota archaeon]|nr:hypothetical protein [Candidatus Bathyarchaeota archaeon]